MKNGDVIGLKYRIIKKLAQGGTSSVFLAENIILSNLWAIKAVDKNSAGITNSMQEVNILKNLNHPMLPRVADLIEDERYTFIVMDYIAGETLAEVISREEKIEETRVINWAKELCDVLSYLHNQRPSPIIYRDLKPANIILGDNGRLHLIDFGTAKPFAPEKSEDTIYIGTQGYAAPEQFGMGKSDERTDLFNLGMTLFHFTSGIHPVKTSLDQAYQFLLQKGVSKEFSSIIRDLIQSDPDKRLNSAEECLQLLSKMGRRKIVSAEKHPKKYDIKLSIAMIGVGHGVGTTLTGISITGWFAKKGFKSAFVDLNQSGDLVQLEKILSLNNRLVQTNEKCYSSGDIIFYKTCSQLNEIPRRDFNVVVADMGCSPREKTFNEFNRADVRLVVCPGVDWKIAMIHDFISVMRQYDPNEEWIFLFTASRPADEKVIRKALQIKNIIAFPFIQNPLDINRYEQKNIQEALVKVLEISGTGIRLR